MKKDFIEACLMSDLNDVGRSEEFRLAVDIFRAGKTMFQNEAIDMELKTCEEKFVRCLFAERRLH